MTEDEKAPVNAEPRPAAPLDHANQLRGTAFKALLRRRKTWLWILGIALPALALFSLAGAWFIGVPVAAFVVLFGILVAFWIADRRAEDAFYDSYCETHGLTRVEGQELGMWTPLLRKGDERDTKEIFRGELAPGITGEIALWTYTEVSHDSKGNRQETSYPFTLVHVVLPTTVEHLPELRVQNKAGFKFLEGLEDKFRAKHERVTLESEAMRDRYEIFVLKGQDPVWVRRLFSPSFIVWLVEKPPKRFAFELEDGHFVAYVPKHRDDVAGLELVTTFGTQIAARLLEEVAQTSPRADRETAQ